MRIFLSCLISFLLFNSLAHGQSKWTKSGDRLNHFNQQAHPDNLPPEANSARRAIQNPESSEQTLMHHKDNTAIEDPLRVSLQVITGRIINEQGEPLAGATVRVKGLNTGVSANENGEFTLNVADPNSILVISRVGYEVQEVSLQARTRLSIQLKISINSLDETVIKGYYTTSRRFNTGSVSKITSSEIGRQPVSNPLATLQGAAPGILVTQSNGLPGSNFTVTIRGMNSIQNGNSPLYVIDGVPFVNDADVLTQRSVINASSPFNTIDPSQIESIEVLKDADATAIYGSRGANGVILITTKKSRSEKLKTEASVYHGWGKITRTVEMMNTTQYLQMRHEAFANDAMTPSPADAYDLLVWDTTRYTDFTKKLIGGTAHIDNANVQVSGGSITSNFTSNINYYRESTVFPGNPASTRFSIQSGYNYSSLNKKFSFGINSSYAIDKNNLIQEDLTQYISLPPNLPELYDSSGMLSWSKGGFPFYNPLSATLKKNQVSTDRLTANGQLQYSLLSSLTAKVSLGYNQLHVDEYNNVPIAAQDPAIMPTGTAYFGDNTVKTWIIEPQMDYRIKIASKLKIQSLLGASWQENKGKQIGINATGYPNDEGLGSVVYAPNLTVKNHVELYRYSAVYGRLHLDWDDKYLVNLTGRRDGSSRFGPAHRFANFGALGFAWVFSNENYIADHLGFLSFGKIRFSYGITGNDLIGNYQYLDSYSPTNYPYQGVPSLFPTKLYNSDYSWEEIRKTNLGLDLGFLKDRIQITADWFQNKSSNQIIYYSLPGQTGNYTVLKNFPGVVQNSGLELQVSTINIQGSSFGWRSSFNLTISRNKLLEFPGLSESSYAQRYMIGKPLNLYIGARYAGVDPATGVYQFYDKDKNLTFSPSDADYVYAGTTDPQYYGGFQNSLNFKKWDLSFLMEFRKQMGMHPVYAAPNMVGDATNRPVAVLDRWQSPGDHKPYQQFTQAYGPAGISIYSLYNSDAVLTDASFIRMKYLMLSYTTEALAKYKITSLQVFVQSQNPFVITGYKGPDPETQRVLSLPPLRRLVIGLKLIL